MTIETYPTRRWALTSLVEWSGKTTFLAANIDCPAYAIDADARWGLSSYLFQGEVRFATPSVIPDPLALMEEAELVMSKGDIKSVAADPVTKIYSVHSRRASMAGRLSVQDRENRGYGKNVAKLHVSKADVIEVLANLSMWGTHAYWSWHQRAGKNSQGKDSTRHRISDIELNVLRQSIDVELLFVKNVNPTWQNGNRDAQQYLYGVQVESARGLAGLPANIGFTIWDRPGNFWRGGAARLERLIYTGFSNPDQAILWARKRFDGDPPVDLAKEYEAKKKQWNPKVHGQMFAAWIEHIDYLVASASGEETTEHDPESLQKQQAKVYYEDATKYLDGSTVGEEDMPDVVIYRTKYGKLPYDKQTLDRAMTMAKEKGNWE